MALLSEVGAEQESVHIFEAAGERLFGIITSPPAEATGTAFLLLGGGFMPSANRNRLWVRIARRLAARGHHVMRMDYRGVGESSGETLVYRLDTPFTQDVLAAVELLRSQPAVKRIVMIGSCFGARTALAVASDVPDLGALVLLAPPGRDLTMGFQRGPLAGGHKRSWRMVLRGLTDPYERMRYRSAVMKRVSSAFNRGSTPAASPRFLKDLRTMANSGIPTHIVFGTDEEYLREFEAARKGPLGNILSSAPNISVHSLPGVIHGFRSLEVQDHVFNWVDAWVEGTFEPTAQRPPVSHTI